MERRTVYAFVTVFVTLVAVGISNVWYTNHVDQQREQAARIAAVERREAAEQVKKTACMLITRIDTEYREHPPETATGKGVAEAWALMRQQFGCA